MGGLVWPFVEDIESARETAHTAAIWSGVLTGFNLLTGVLAGLSIFVLVVCLVYGIAAWRIYQGSRAWAVTAFVLFVFQALLVLFRLPLIWSVLTPFAFLALMNGVRATSSLEKLEEKELMKNLTTG